MNTVDQVWELLRSAVAPGAIETSALSAASGRVLREDVCAPEDQPPFDRSAVDGFVVMADDASAEFELAGEIRAGDWKPGLIPPGQTWRISTGGAVPCDGCEVVMLEDAEVSEGRVRFLCRGRNHTRRRGEDVRAGAVVVTAGTVIGSGVAGLLASLGCSHPRVSAQPSVLHVATGDELVDPGDTPGPGQIRDANSALVRAWCARRGLTLQQTRVPEDGAALAAAIRGSRDILLVSGGASVGEHDSTAAVLEADGFELLVTRVNVRPGRPLVVARRGDEWALGLPGNPLSHFACLHVFADALLAALLGRAPQPAVLRGITAGSCAGNPRETWWPASECAEGLRPLRWASSGDLTALASADALLRVPPDSGLAPGEVAEFIRVA